MIDHIRISITRIFGHFSVLAVLLVLLGFISCENDPDKTGIGVIPDSEKPGIFYNDTTTVIIHSVYYDSVKTSNTAKSMLGSYLDPVFGLHTVGIVTQVRLSTVSLNFGENPVLDSIVLSLEYTFGQLGSTRRIFSYGDTSTLQTIKVFEIDEDLHIDSVYYSNHIPQIKPSELASVVTTFKPRDSVMVDTVKVKAQLRLRLSDDFGNQILNAPAEAKQSVDGFLKFMKGLYIVPQPVNNGGALVFFDLLAIPSRLTLYYKNNSGERKSYVFFINSQCARYMTFQRDYTLASPEFREQLEGDSTLGREQFYLQGLGSVEARVSFPFISDWALNQKILLNEARLVFYNSDTTTGFLPPFELYLGKRNEKGVYEILPDEYDGTTYFGGQYNPKTGGYHFRITQTLQKIISGQLENRPLIMGVTNGSIIPARAVIIGTSPSDSILYKQRAKLILKYTRLN